MINMSVTMSPMILVKSITRYCYAKISILSLLMYNILKLATASLLISACARHINVRTREPLAHMYEEADISTISI